MSNRVEIYRHVDRLLGHEVTAEYEPDGQFVIIEHTEVCKGYPAAQIIIPLTHLQAIALAAGEKYLEGLESNG